MLVKINGVPIEELAKEGVDVGLSIKDAYHLIHTPINLDVGMNTHHWFTADMNIFNIPHHAYDLVQPHVNMILERLF
jgi:hypothetical protein